MKKSAIMPGLLNDANQNKDRVITTVSSANHVNVSATSRNVLETNQAAANVPIIRGVTYTKVDLHWVHEANVPIFPYELVEYFFIRDGAIVVDGGEA